MALINDKALILKKEYFLLIIKVDFSDIKNFNNLRELNILNKISLKKIKIVVAYLRLNKILKLNDISNKVTKIVYI